MLMSQLSTSPPMCPPIWFKLNQVQVDMNAKLQTHLEQQPSLSSYIHKVRFLISGFHFRFQACRIQAAGWLLVRIKTEI